MPSEKLRQERRRLVAEVGRQHFQTREEAIDAALRRMQDERDVHDRAVDALARRDDQEDPLFPTAEAVKSMVDAAVATALATFRDSLLRELAEVRIDLRDADKKVLTGENLRRAFSVPDTVNKLAWSVAKGAAVAAGGAVLGWFGLHLGAGAHKQ